MFASPAFAQAAGASPQAGGPPFLLNILPFILMIGIFYLLLWRPQQRAQKTHKAKLEAAKKGDTVVTGGGLIGKVIRVDGDEVELELGPNVRVRALKSTLSDVRGVGLPAND